MLQKMFVLWAGVGLVVLSSTSLAVVVNFESIPAGTIYGNTAGDSPGDMVLSVDGIDMSVEDFYVGSWTGFYDAEIGGVYGSTFPTQSLSISNINMLFDFAGVGFPVQEVSFEYIDLGGAENIAVNGGMIHEVSLLSTTPVNIGPGVTLAGVTELPTGGGVTGVVTLTGPIQSLLIGGQEFAIDNLRVIGETTGDPDEPPPGGPCDPNDPDAPCEPPPGGPNGPEGPPPLPPGDMPDIGIDITCGRGAPQAMVTTLFALVALRAVQRRRPG